MSDDTYLHLAGIHKRFEHTVVLHDIHLSVRRGEMLCFLGPSGCGKTTLLRMIGGIAFPDAGNLALDREEISQLPPKRRPSWQTFNPCVTQLDCTFWKFERNRREMARFFRYSTAVASSHLRPPSAVFCGWNVHGMNAVKPPVSSCKL